jgi:glutamate-1-semialdehyde 2,1-aminomutase
MKKFVYARSHHLFKEIQKYVQGGVSSGTRLWTDVCPTDLPCSIFVKKAFGSRITDVDGNEYIDYRLGFGPVILGHSFPAIHKAVHKADEKGLVYALDNETEIAVAKKIHQAVPCAEKIRFTNSGTESTMTAIRVARGYTNKEKILKFHGHYHGHHDYLLFSTNHCSFEPCKEPASLGIPHALQDLVHVEEWNDFEGVENTLKQHHNEIAAMILEPVMANATVIPPAPGFLKHLRELCDRYDVLLIFDEVKTGFRLGMSGAQGLFKVIPDLATFAKSLGNGYPIACVAGKNDIMSMIRKGGVFHGGTYAANPVSLTAANATLDYLKHKDVHGKIDGYGRKMMKGVQQALDEHSLPGIVQGYPGIFSFIFTNKEKITSFNQLEKCNFELFAKIHTPLLKEGVMLDQDPEEPVYTCYSHNTKDLQQTLEGIHAVFGDARKKR